MSTMHEHRNPIEEYVSSVSVALTFAFINAMIMRYSFEFDWAPATVMGGLIGAISYVLDVAVWRYTRERRHAMIEDPTTSRVDDWIFWLRHRMRVWHLAALITVFLALNLILVGLWTAQFVLYLVLWATIVSAGRIYDVHRNLRRWCPRCGLRVYATEATDHDVSLGDEEAPRS